MNIMKTVSTDAESTGVIFKHFFYVMQLFQKRKKSCATQTLGGGGGGVGSCTGKTEGCYVPGIHVDCRIISFNVQLLRR